MNGIFKRFVPPPKPSKDSVAIHEDVVPVHGLTSVDSYTVRFSGSMHSTSDLVFLGKAIKLEIKRVEAAFIVPVAEAHAVHKALIANRKDAIKPYEVLFDKVMGRLVELDKAETPVSLPAPTASVTIVDFPALVKQVVLNGDWELLLPNMAVINARLKKVGADFHLEGCETKHES